MQWKPIIAALLLSLASGPAVAAELKLEVEIPSLAVAEYHRPYVAVWIERAQGPHARNLALWYDLDDEGTQWLKDLRLWWRRSGRQLAFPVDGLSGATRPVGRHRLSFAADAPPLADLPAGEYRLVVEAVREVGGRELIRLPFRWPVTTAQQQQQSGARELGRVVLELIP